MKIEAGALPDNAFLNRYCAEGYTDCFFVDVDGAVDLASFITGFYTSWLFKIERVILKLVKRPSTDQEVTQLAHGTRKQFAAWDVEDRAEDQILMCDMAGRTRSWLHVMPQNGGTRLYFGSAVVPDQATGRMGWMFHALMGFHKLYSVLLLKAAARRV